MFVVESYAAVRRFVFVEGHSRREAAEVFGLNRDTVRKMCLYSAPPGYGVHPKPGAIDAAGVVRQRSG
jgi:transposase